AYNALALVQASLSSFCVLSVLSSSVSWSVSASRFWLQLVGIALLDQPCPNSAALGRFVLPAPPTRKLCLLAFTVKAAQLKHKALSRRVLLVAIRMTRL